MSETDCSASTGAARILSSVLNWRASVAAAFSPTQKKVAFARWRSSRSRTWGVTAGSGPSSNVRLISLRAAAAGGSRTRFAPSSWPRGQNTAAVRRRRFAATAPSAQGHHAGRIAAVATATASSDMENQARGAGRHG